MFGNLHGWMISLVLAILVLAPVGWLVRMSRITPPSGIALDPGNLMPIALPIQADAAWPIFTDDADAADLYRRVIDAWNDDSERQCEQFVQSPSGKTPPVIQSLIDARHCKRMELFSHDLPAVINYDNEHPQLESLFAAGQWTYKAGLSLHIHGQAKDADAFLEAAYALGRQLYEERIVYDECDKGLQLMQDAAEAQCQNSTRGSELFDSLSDFQNRLTEYRGLRLTPIWQVISSVDADLIAHTAGDVAAMAEHSGEPMWRVEATLKLGRYRYNAATMGDQIGARHELQRLMNDREAAVAVAAKAASELTIETYRMIR